MPPPLTGTLAAQQFGWSPKEFYDAVGDLNEGGSYIHSALKIVTHDNHRSFHAVPLNPSSYTPTIAKGKLKSTRRLNINRAPAQYYPNILVDLSGSTHSVWLYGYLSRAQYAVEFPDLDDFELVQSNKKMSSVYRIAQLRTERLTNGKMGIHPVHHGWYDIELIRIDGLNSNEEAIILGPDFGIVK